MHEPGRVLALDVGDVRTGVAISDPMRLIASPLTVVRQPSRAKTIDALCRIVEEQAPVLIVAGLPLCENGDVGPQAQRVMRFVEHLRQCVDIPVVFEDERYTTVAAEEVLSLARVRSRKRKDVVDKVAATQILQQYLEGHAPEETPLKSQNGVDEQK